MVAGGKADVGENVSAFCYDPISFSSCNRRVSYTDANQPQGHVVRQGDMTVFIPQTRTLQYRKQRVI